MIAVDATRAFCRPRLSASAWLAGLDPLLTLQAASAYATIDPGRVACTRVLSSPVPHQGDAFSQVVLVLTDAGAYRVLLTRAAPHGDWLIALITREERR